jgi:hypothetical protein
MFCSSPAQISKQLSRPVIRRTMHPQNSRDWFSDIGLCVEVSMGLYGEISKKQL